MSRRAGNSFETVNALRVRRAMHAAEAELLTEERARLATKKPARVAFALVVAAELTLLAAGFAAGESARVVVSDGDPGACATCEATATK